MPLKISHVPAIYKDNLSQKREIKLATREARKIIIFFFADYVQIRTFDNPNRKTYFASDLI